MASMSDVIENYLKDIINKNKAGYVKIKRNELANMFNCAPSQINYVLSTRFTVNHGFIIKSQRGGGGYVRVEKLPLKNSDWLKGTIELIGESITQQEALGVAKRLLDEKLIDNKEYRVIEVVIKELDFKLSGVKLEKVFFDNLRARLLKSMLVAFCNRNCK